MMKHYDEFLKKNLKKKKFFKHFYAVVDEEMTSFLSFLKKTFNNHGFKLETDNLCLLNEKISEKYSKNINVKPVKYLMKSNKKFKTYVKKPLLSYALFISSGLSLVTYLLLGNFFTFFNLLYLSVFLAIGGFLNYLIKEEGFITIWLKTVGFYENGENKLKFLIGTDCSEDLLESEARNHHDLVTNELNNSFLKHKNFNQDLSLKNVTKLKKEFQEIEDKIVEFEKTKEISTYNKKLDKELKNLENKKTEISLILDYL